MPRKPSSPKITKKKIEPAILIAVIGLIGTIITAFFTSPVLIAFIQRTPSPTVVILPSESPASANTASVTNTDDVKLKTTLIRQLGSKDNKFTSDAREQLYIYNWLTDGTLRNADLLQANLRGLDFMQADFQGAGLNWTILQDANFMYANLENANLFAATACKTNFAYANLKSTSLFGTNLRQANFDMADLRGANLYSSNLYKAIFHQTKLDETTTLPDGGHWTPNTDMSIFTETEGASWSTDAPNRCLDVATP